MIQSIRVKNFQSLQDINLELGRFTVIVGPSSSGKSALTRAIKAVASNSLDADNITQGSKHSAISVTTDIGTVTIERNSGDSSVYKIAKVGNAPSSYSKLNRKVPTEVTEILGIAPSTLDQESINFAGQHDPPYLLKDNSSSVARILGELTNVSTIFAAVKEASRRSKAASTLLNLRKKDLDKVVTQITEYASIANKATAITKAETALTEATRMQSQVDSLQTLTARAVAASEALQAIKKIPELPNLASVLKAQKDLDAFIALIRQLSALNKIIQSQGASLKACQSAILQSSEELHQHLADLGHCPLCNQNIL
jgi:DNA repair ATPase RecN